MNSEKLNKLLIDVNKELLRVQAKGDNLLFYFYNTAEESDRIILKECIENDGKYTAKLVETPIGNGLEIRWQ